MCGDLLSTACMNVGIHLGELLGEPDLGEVLADPFEAFTIEIVEAVVECDGQHLCDAVDTARAGLC